MFMKGNLAGMGMGMDMYGNGAALDALGAIDSAKMQLKMEGDPNAFMDMHNL